MEKIKDLSLKAAIIIYMAAALAISTVLSFSLTHYAENVQEDIWFKYVDKEEYMESIQYEGLPAQKRAHEAFIDKMENIDLDKIEEEPQEYLQHLIEFLLSWLINHILYTDKKIPLVKNTMAID